MVCAVGPDRASRSSRLEGADVVGLRALLALADLEGHALALWVPETLHTSCDLVILVNQPTEPGASSNVVGLGCCAVGEGS